MSTSSYEVDYDAATDRVGVRKWAGMRFTGRLAIHLGERLLAEVIGVHEAAPPHKQRPALARKRRCGNGPRT